MVFQILELHTAMPKNMERLILFLPKLDREILSLLRCPNFSNYQLILMVAGFLAILLYFTNASKLGKPLMHYEEANKPPTYPLNIPLIGHMLPMAWDTPGFLSKVMSVVIKAII